MITIAIANQKGGVAKTTTAVTIATGLARRNHKVVLVDTDAQGNAALSLGIEPADDLFRLLVAEMSLGDCIHTNGDHHLAIIRSSQRTATAKLVLATERTPVNVLARALAPLRDRADFCIIDTAPTVDPLSLATLYAADYVLIPTLCETLSLDGIQKISATIIKLQREHKAPTRLLGILPTKYRQGTKEHRANLKELTRVHRHLVYPPIPLATAVAEAVAYQETIWVHTPDGPATEAYRQVLDRILTDVKA